MLDLGHVGKVEREVLYRIIEHLIGIIDDLLDRNKIAVSAKGQIMPAKIAVGGKGALFTFTEFDGPGGTGNAVPPSGPITYASDNVAVATVDTSGNVTAVSPGTANITGVDPASANKVAAGDVLTVTPAVGAVAVSATGVLTAN
jgi:Big-like domain-containing protein